MPPETLSLTDAAIVLGVTRRNTVRELLSLNALEGRQRYVAGYDAQGRLLLRGDLVRELARTRALRGEWRSRNLGHWSRPARRGAHGQWLCAHPGCGVVVSARAQLCDRHGRPT